MTCMMRAIEMSTLANLLVLQDIPTSRPKGSARACHTQIGVRV